MKESGFIQRNVLHDAYNVADFPAISNGQATLVGLEPFLLSNYVGREKVDEAAEQLKIQTVVLTAAVVASQKYQIKLGNARHREESDGQPLMPFGYEAPAVLTGSADDDKYNLFKRLQKALNQQNRAFVDTYILFNIKVDGGAGGGAVTGETLVNTTQGTGNIGFALNTIAVSGTVQLAIYEEYVDHVIAENDVLTFSGGGTVDANNTVAADFTRGNGVRIHDKDWGLATSNYYPPNRTDRGGESSIYPTAGFVAGDIAVTQAAVYAVGQGADLLALKPVKERTSDNLVSGDNDYIFSPEGDVPASGTAYDMIELTYKKDVSTSALTDFQSPVLMKQRIYCATAAYAAVDAQLTALGLT